jgi:hypothetical protein
VAQDWAFMRHRRRATMLAPPLQVDREARLRRPQSSAPVGESHCFSDVVGDEDGGESWSCRTGSSSRSMKPLA